MPPQHEHGLATLPIELLEENQRSFVQSQTSFLIAVNNVKRILSPVGVDVVLFQCGRKDSVARILQADAERLEDLDAMWVTSRRAGRILLLRTAGAGRRRRRIAAIAVGVDCGGVGGVGKVREGFLDVRIHCATGIGNPCIPYIRS